MYLINETAPTVLYERIFVQIVAIISAIVNAIIFGSIAVLMQELNRSKMQLQEEEDAAATAMTDLGIPLES
jgi:hypothetical protein